MVKRCTRCGLLKAEDMFYLVSQRGEPYRRARCKACDSRSALDWNRRNPEQAKDHCRKWRASHRAEDAASARRWAINNPERLRKTHRAYYEQNLDKIRRQALQWGKDNPDKMAARVKARKLRIRVPYWANKQYMEDMYMLAKLVSKFTGNKYHVDHIVPLTSNRVCGLHVEHNLQVILGSDNISKRNTHWPDMP